MLHALLICRRSCRNGRVDDVDFVIENHFTLENKRFLGGEGSYSKKEIYSGLVCFIYRRFTSCVGNEEIRCIPFLTVQTKFR